MLGVVDFFSGCGGTALGFKRAGMQIIAAIDNDPDAANTYRLNFPGVQFFERDIRSISVEEIGDILPRGMPMLFSGCAPCQPFSKHNQDSAARDPRRFLLQEFQRFVIALRPEFVIVENVPGLQRIGNRGPLRTFLRSLRAAGYDVQSSVLAALNYGVPQVRRRLVLIASRVGSVAMPKPTHGPDLLRPSTVRDWISDLPPLEAGGQDPIDPDHAAMRLSEMNLKRIMATPEGGGRYNWDADLGLDCHEGHKGHSDVYGRLAWDKPASALTTRCLSYSNGRFGHPEQHRAISLREAACLQTFPRRFRFSGSLTSRGRQVGNAVPPLLAYSLGKEVVRTQRMSTK